MERITIDVNGVSFVMIPIEGGSFMMGATVEQRSEAWDNEKPIRNVTLSPYYLGETVVTQALWEAVMQETGEAGSDLPVTGKCWNDCQEFIGRLNELTGKTFRMPTEAEWENAARGGNRGHGYKFAGSNNINDVAWYDANSGSCVHPVKQKQPNELGLYDMTGNVFEWCFDRYGQYGEDPETDPIGPSSGSQRVYRGGAFSYYQRGCRLSCRFGVEPYGKDYGKIGLRLAMSESQEGQTGIGVGMGAPIGNNNRNSSGKSLEGKTAKIETSDAFKNKGKGKEKGKKKIWPWIVFPIGGIFLLLFLLFLVGLIADRDDTSKIDPPVPEVVIPRDTVNYSTPASDVEDEIIAKIQNAEMILANNSLTNSKWENYDPMIGELSKGWNSLMEAASLNENDTMMTDYSNRINTLKNNYLEHIGPIYKDEKDNLDKLKKRPKEYENLIQDGERRIGQLYQFSGKDEVLEWYDSHKEKK